MPPADADALTGRSPTARNGVLSPGLSSVSLSRDHITEALAKSPDHGATLDLTHKNLTDVGEGAEELATVVRDTDDETDGTVARYVTEAYRVAYNRILDNFIFQNLVGPQSSHYSSHGLRTSFSLTVPGSKEQQLYRLP